MAVDQYDPHDPISKELPEQTRRNLRLLAGVFQDIIVGLTEVKAERDAAGESPFGPVEQAVRDETPALPSLQFTELAQSVIELPEYNDSQTPNVPFAELPKVELPSIEFSDAESDPLPEVGKVEIPEFRSTFTEIAQEQQPSPQVVSVQDIPTVEPYDVRMLDESQDTVSFPEVSKVVAATEFDVAISEIESEPTPQVPVFKMPSEAINPVEFPEVVADNINVELPKLSTEADELRVEIPKFTPATVELPEIGEVDIAEPVQVPIGELPEGGVFEYKFHDVKPEEIQGLPLEPVVEQVQPPSIPSLPTVQPEQSSVEFSTEQPETIDVSIPNFKSVETPKVEVQDVETVEPPSIPFVKQVPDTSYDANFVTEVPQSELEALGLDPSEFVYEAQLPQINRESVQEIKGHTSHGDPTGDIGKTLESLSSERTYDPRWESLQNTLTSLHQEQYQLSDAIAEFMEKTLAEVQSNRHKINRLVNEVTRMSY